MADQADRLRRLRLVSDDEGGPTEGWRRPAVRTIAVISGKGGVGKSIVVTNVAIACARRGRRVLLVDGDLSLANVDLLMGLIPKRNLADVIYRQVPIEEVVLETPSGVRLLPAASGIEALANLDDYRLEHLLRELSRLEDTCDLILLDTPTGIGAQALHLASAAETTLIVTTPEPTAFSDAYATLKVLHQRGVGDALLLINRAASSGEARKTARRIQSVAKRFLDFEPEYLGFIPEDSALLASAMRQEPLLTIFPHSPAAQAIEAIAEGLLAEPGPVGPITIEPEHELRKVANLDR